MSVTANGAGDLSYQWTKNGYNIGTNSKTLSINNISNNDAGFYKVLVTGACGTALSDSTKLSVQPNILITNKLIPQTVNEGNYVSFLIQATEFGVTNNYQWKKNGINLTNSANVSGVNNNKLTIPKADMESQGLYTVDVSNNCNTLKSNEVALVVNKKVGSPPIVSSIESIETMANIHIAPNPSVEYILVNGFFLNNSDVNIEIINLEGKLLYTKKINQFSNQGAANND